MQYLRTWQQKPAVADPFADDGFPFLGDWVFRNGIVLGLNCSDPMVMQVRERTSFQCLGFDF